MSFKEVKELRKTGKLDEALILAQQDLANEPENIWNKRSIAWVYYDTLKNNSTLDKFDKHIEILRKLQELELPEEEKMIFDTCVFQVGKLLFTIAKSDKPDYSKVNTIFNFVKGFRLTKPSESYSFLYKAFHKTYKGWPAYLSFADWWNYEYFRSEDYLPEEYNGKRIMSIVEQAYIAYSKKLLEGEEEFAESEHGHVSLGKVIKKDHIKEFLPKLDKLIESHPEYQYPAYFKAKLLLSIGGGEEGLLAFIPFARKKKNDFWVWDLMADLFAEGDNRKLSCLCRALLCRSQNEFLIKTREKLASILIEKQQYKEAKIEIAQIVNVRINNGWAVKGRLANWLNEDWYKSTAELGNNIALYKEKAPFAEELLFGDIQEELVVVEYVNSHKKILNFIVNREKTGFFKYDRFLKSVNVGDVLLVRFDGEGRDKFFKTLTVKKTDELSHESIIKKYEDEITIRDNQSFGFVEDIFVEPKLISRYQLKNGDKIKGRAILSFNKNKNKWGFKVFEIE
ncbi:MAG: hypothetical protein DRJ10_01350 [Bacteroidetes bacterium]|nr:MAG: hypothetical protein DRJ10_01350 [Bacteroidota bacterium]